MAFKYVFVAIVASAITLFALQNSAPTSLRFLAWGLDAIPWAMVIRRAGRRARRRSSLG